MFLIKKKITLLIFFVLSLAIILFFFTQNKNNNEKIGGDFDLTNHLGDKITNDSFNDYHRLVFFGFTNCPDLCPNTLNNVGTIIDEIDKKNKIVPIFITVDPERDTVNKLNDYLKNFHPKIIGLTGTKEQIKNVKSNYKIFSKKIIDMKDMDEKKDDHHDSHDHGGYSVDHTTIIYLMDKKGFYITHFSPESKNSEIINKLNKYL